LTHANKLGRKVGRELIQKKIAEAAAQYKLKVNTNWLEQPLSSVFSCSTSYMGSSVAGEVELFDTYLVVDGNLNGMAAFLGPETITNCVNKFLDECGF
jgi:hypothetical protein